MKEIVISNMMRAKNKQSFFALHQIQSKIKSLYPDVNVEFHILWDDTNECNHQSESKWSDLMDIHINNLYSYDKEFFNDYVREVYGLDYSKEIKTWKAIYYVLMAHYLRRVKLKQYYLIYDDDILINDNFKHITDLMIDQIPFGITEPLNQNCDKVLFNKLVDTFGEGFISTYQNKNPNFYGLNAGFQGIDLSIYDNFLSADRFQFMLDLFSYQSIIDENGNEIWGHERSMIDTQQQSFFGLMNVVFSRNQIHILDPEKYFIVPNWGNHPVYGDFAPEDEYGGWQWALDSKITHFIGHTMGKGKPKQFLDKVDEYLKLNNFL